MAVPAKLTIHTDPRSPFLTEAYVMGVLSSGNALSGAYSKLDIFPGFCDVHVHLREPGFSYKETIGSGTRACARGGYTTVCAMPNLNPVPDSVEHLNVELDRIRCDACMRVLPYGSISVGEAGKELADLEGMAPYAVAFSDDGKGLQDPGLMLEAMQRAKALGKLIVAHCEDNTLLKGGYIHDGEYARLHGHAGICAESEWRPIQRDLDLCAKTGCAYHVCHISTKESVELIRRAKREGLNVSCETGPHYLVLDENDLQEDGRFKMNPPLRSPADREALIQGILDGTVDMIATDHAPHSAEEKAKGLRGSAFGIVGLETAFPVLYTKLVRTGILSLEKLMDLLAFHPRRRLSIPLDEKDYSIWNLNEAAVVDPAQFLTKGRATPFAGWELYGVCMTTVCDGRVVYDRQKK